MRRSLFLLVPVLLAPACARHPSATAAAAGPSATGEFISFDGRKVGEARLVQTSAGVHVHAEFASIAPGVHGFHIHSVGLCDAPTFATAGPHFNPAARKHGLMNPEGHHAGDLPNVRIPTTGGVKVDTTTTDVTLGAGAGSLLDADGSSLVLHDAPDDYKTDPSGNSGRRIACAVIKANP